MTKLFSSFCFLFLLASCGTTVGGIKQNVKVHIVGEEKNTVYLNGEEIKNFNGTVSIDKKNSDNFLTVTNENYNSVHQYFSREINPCYLTGDALWLLGAPIAVAVDFITGGIYDINPSNLRIVMRRKD